MEEISVCSYLYHATQILNRIPECPACGRPLNLKPDWKCEHDVLAGICTLCRGFDFTITKEQLRKFENV